MLDGRFLSVLGASDRPGLRREVVAFAHALGFDTVSAMAVLDHGVGRSEFVTVDNAPAEYAQVLGDAQASRRDPVMQHCRHQSVPIVWDRETYRRENADELWRQQAAYGYCNGIALALHMPHGRHFAIGVERAAPLPRDPGVLTRMVADLQLFAVHAQDAAMRVLLTGARPSVTLTRRETEALHWTMRGKTAWEVGTILGISERTAVLHLNNAMHKLQCTSKHQAVLQALRLGLLDEGAALPPSNAGASASSSAR